MFNIFKTAALSAMLGLGAVASMPAAAQADGLYLNFGSGHGPRVGVYLGDGGYTYRRHRPAPACTPSRAVNKAQRLGVRHARIANVNRRTIKVSGRKNGHRTRITFARSPNCPIVRW